MKLHGNSGSRNTQSCLTEKQVRIIKMCLDYEWASGVLLSQLFDVSEATISTIRNEKAWKHVQIEIKQRQINHEYDQRR